jgi:hypothetical protein
MNIGINKYEKEGYLIIKDSLKAYFSSSHDSNDDNNNAAWNVIDELAKRAKNSGKNGVTVIADLGSFFHHDLVIHKDLLTMNCLYHHHNMTMA